MRSASLSLPRNSTKAPRSSGSLIGEVRGGWFQRMSAIASSLLNSVMRVSFSFFAFPIRISAGFDCEFGHPRLLVLVRVIMWASLRSRYARDAKPLVGPIKQRLLLFATFANMDNDRPKKDIPLPGLFSGLSQRIPMFDKSPMLSLFRRSSVGDIFNLIFQAQRPTVPQIDS